MDTQVPVESRHRATPLQLAGCRTSRRSDRRLPIHTMAMALIALVAPAAQAGVEFVTPIGNCTARVDAIGDGKDLFIIASSNVQFEVFGNAVDLSDPNSGFLDSPINLTSNIQRSLFFRMPLGDESRLQMTIRAYPTINSLTWTSVQSAIGCIVKTGTFERLEQDHKIRIVLPAGHRLDQTLCDQKTLVAQVSPSNIGELDIPFSGSASIGGWQGFNDTVTGLPAFMQSSQFVFNQPQFPRRIPRPDR